MLTIYAGGRKIIDSGNEYKLLDESYEYEMEDELDYIMDDNSLSDMEREQAISNLYSKYNLHESNSCDGWIAFYNGKKLEIPKSDVDGGIYEAKQKAIKELKVPKSKIELLSIKPAYNESLKESLDIDYSEGNLFSDDLSNLDWYSFWDEDYERTWYAAKDSIGRFEATIWPTVDGYDIYVEIDNKPFYDHRIRFRDTDQAIRFVDEMFMEEIFMKQDDFFSESLTESVAGDIIWEKVRDYIQELIETEVVDNLASVVSSEIPEYNPDWCGDSSFTSQRAVEKLAEELATELMFNLE
jgi:hypothetical protein